uniref:MADF domain-containing protein n=1 Tax=Anopheles culicifacies TaxID=139723 RepID=A0A182MM25_9DIPT
MANQPAASKKHKGDTTVRGWNISTTEGTSRFIKLVEKHPELLVRLSLERLLPAWEKLVPVTGISAREMAGKWKRLCERYRSELRREMNATTKYNATWVHFQEMDFARKIEKKRIRTHRGDTCNNTAINVTRIKVEPSSPSKLATPRVLVVSEPGNPYRADLNNTTPKVVEIRPSQKSLIKNFIPIEKVMIPVKRPIALTKQNIIQDLQLQAGRIITTRKQPVHRIPIQNLSDAGISNAPDNDYDFLMIRIYPLLSALPPHLKRVCYEKMQNFIVNLYKTVNQTARQKPTTGFCALHNPQA